MDINKKVETFIATLNEEQQDMFMDILLTLLAKKG